MPTVRVKGPWHPPGTTPIEELTQVKEQLERGRLSFPWESTICSVCVFALYVPDIVKGHYEQKR